MTSDPANRGSYLGVKQEDEIVIAEMAYKGVDNRMGTAARIPKGYSPSLANCSLIDDSRVLKRDGYKFSESGEGWPSTAEGVFIADYDRGPNSRLLIAGFNGDGIYHCHSPDGPAWSRARVYKTMSGDVDEEFTLSSDRAKMTQGNNLMWLMTPDTGHPVHVMDETGNLINCGDARTSPPSRAGDTVYMLGRIWMVEDNRLYWSKLLPTIEDLVPEPKAFDRDNAHSTGGGYIELSPEQGADPVGIVGWRDSSLIVFFTNQIEEISINSAAPLLSSRRRLEGNYGCGARDTIMQVGMDIYFLDQYGALRSLKQNEIGNDQGLIPLPVSDRIRKELPGNINPRCLYKACSGIVNEFMYIAYPAGQCESPDRLFVFDLGRAEIVGPHTPAHPVARFATSDIEGGGYRLYSLTGGTSSRVARWSDGYYTDGGTAISFVPESKAYDLEFPQVDKTPVWYDIEFVGNVGATALFETRTSENDSYTAIRTKQVESTGVVDFPILAADFPLTDAANFPLHDAPPKVTTMKGVIDETHLGDLPLYDQHLPITISDLPIDGGGGVGSGRVIQWRVSNADDRSPFELVAVRVAARVQNVELEVEP